MRTAALLKAACLSAACALGGCVSDSGTGSVSTGFFPSRKEAADPDAPKQVCEATLIANEPKTVCY